MVGLEVARQAGGSPRRPTAVWAAAGAWAGSLVTVTVGLVLGGGNPSPYLLVDSVQGLVYPAVGGLVAARRPRNPVGWLLVGIGAAHGLDVLTGALLLRGVPLAAWAENWLWFPGLGTLTAVLPFVVPDGRPPGRRWRPFLLLSAGTVGLATLVAMAQPTIQGRPGELLTNPVGVPGAAAAVGPAFVLYLTCSVVAVASFVRRWMTSDRDMRRALLPVLVAVVVVVLALVTVKAVQELGGGPAAGPLVQAVVLPLIPVSVAVSVLRHRLFDIELVLRRSVVYLVLAVLLGAVYAALIFVTTGLLRHRFPTVPVTVATVGVALGFAPLRTVVQRAVSRVLFGDRDDPYAVLSALGHRLAAARRPGGALDGVTELVCRTLRVPAASLVGRNGTVVAATGTLPPAALRLPIVIDGEEEGELLVAPRAPGETFGRRDRELLEDLARSAGPALRSDRLAAELRRSRERLVAAREEERRRLRRDLHDGLGPALAAITLQLDVAEAQLTRDIRAAGELLAEVRRSAAHVVADMRRVVSDLRPAELDDLGLPAALDRVAERISPGGPAVSVRCAPLPALSAAVEVAAYRIVQEAVTNAVRHSGARRVTVDVAARDGELTVCVQDDGTGLRPDAVPGVGTESMRERAAELGGAVDTRSRAAGGTQVAARLPLEPR
ncbi:sensor histidine kinase [Microbispora sp. KK1-11]|uniref:sensor histidine kinase n=1 Tax=Microbispora sp. KK1-11 TaxID=2053005 RepID=UPI00115A8BA5|nr:sensor histidine kinase [Microbispora sp. KK1-11]TQS26157.1 sensor histidine kinase [Microbispora sp. KK1-11]